MGKWYCLQAPASYTRGGAPGTHCVVVRVRPRADLHPMVKRKSFPRKCKNSDFHSLACRLTEHLLTHLVAYFMSASRLWHRTSCYFRNILNGILGPNVRTPATYLEVRVSNVDPDMVYVEDSGLLGCDSVSRVTLSQR
jgi:hypothetical protein